MPLADEVGRVPRGILPLPVSGESVITPEPQIEMAPELDDVDIGRMSRGGAVRQFLAGVMGARLRAEVVPAAREPLCLLE